jgi:CDP-diacylglycerol--serine O-phosphatidyltransferase
MPKHVNHKKIFAARRKSIWRFLALPDYFSLASLSCSLIAMNISTKNHFAGAALLIMASAVLDGMDGIVARFINRRGRFGAELDSIADVIAFGVAPAVFLFSLGLNRNIDFIILVLFVIASALRLARFNILKMKGHYFIGLPTTANGIIIPALYFILVYFKADWFITQITFLFWLSVSLLLMTSRITVPKPHLEFNHNHNAPNQTK